ncbi:hypothetical protein B0H63DRAFT_451953 [Podospora didyma]|uniref:Uncharacterized protein n=1 Tax=Podospora didyma TaxID=330526 RepID=A0AAE0KJW7_9PEZI|nr:hypothetical protein B0H63DRAFT_451953 [Podospora didyma]
MSISRTASSLRPLGQRTLMGTNALRNNLQLSAPSRFQMMQYSTQPAPSSKSATGNFYKTFTRPVAKCLLLAMLVYQIAYWGWVKLEQDEIKVERLAGFTLLKLWFR